MPSVVTTSHFVAGKINANGRIVIPAAIRRQMGIKPGESVLMDVEDGVLAHGVAPRPHSPRSGEFAASNSTGALPLRRVDRGSAGRSASRDGGRAWIRSPFWIPPL